MSKYEVCPDCEGEGFRSVLGAFTASDVDEWFAGDWDERDQFARDMQAGSYDEPCPLCKGQRVVTAEQVRAAEELWEAEAIGRAEMRMGC